MNLNDCGFFLSEYFPEIFGEVVIPGCSEMAKKYLC